MDRDKYINLLERRQVYKKNIGALDFLIALGAKRNYLSRPDKVYLRNFSRSQKYNELHRMNLAIRNNPRINEFPFLLDYANLLRSVQMTDTYVGLIRYLIAKTNHLDARHQNTLLKHVRSAYLVTNDEYLFDLLERVHPTSIRQISLPQAIVARLSENHKLNIRVGASTHDIVFSHQKDPLEIGKILSEHKDKLLREQWYGLSMNLAAAIENPSAYLDALNAMLADSALEPIAGIDFSTNNVLATVATKRVPAAKDHGLITIVMSCFNSQSTVAYALESLLSQSYRNIEVLVCDDRSEDNSLNVICEMASKDKRIKVYRSNGNQGTYNIRNALLREANGEFITFQDADDWSHHQRLEQQVDYLVGENVPVCSSRWIRVDPKGRVIFFVDGRAFKFSVVSTMVRRSVFSVVPKFRESLVAADTEFHEACIKFFGEDNVRIIDKPLIIGLWGDGSLTQRPGLQAQNNGHVAQRRREYSDIAAKQRVLGSSLFTDMDIEDVLKRNGIYREFKGIERWA